MHKILYISHFHENSGASVAAINYVRAMRSVGLDVICKSVLLNSSKSQPPDDIQELLKKDSKNCDICIQHVLPHYLDYNGNMKNIAIVILETQNLNLTHWSTKINTMDEAWIPYKSGLLESSITIPKKLVPHAFNILEYRIQEPLNLPPGYKFYFVGEFSKRKNIAAIIKAFHYTFTPNEPVQLILKLNKFNMTSQQLNDEVYSSIKKIKEGMKLYQIDKYKPEILISDFLSRQDLLRLYFSCDCFINASYGEAWSIPTFEAMCMGSNIISNTGTAPDDYLKKYRYAELIPSTVEPCFGALDTFPNLYTSREHWYSINIISLSQAMRKMYESNSLRFSRMSNGLKIANDYSYNNIGSLITKLL